MSTVTFKYVRSIADVLYNIIYVLYVENNVMHLLVPSVVGQLYTTASEPLI